MATAGPVAVAAVKVGQNVNPSFQVGPDYGASLPNICVMAPTRFDPCFDNDEPRGQDATNHARAWFLPRGRPQ